MDTCLFASLTLERTSNQILFATHQKYARILEDSAITRTYNSINLFQLYVLPGSLFVDFGRCRTSYAIFQSQIVLLSAVGNEKYKMSICQGSRVFYFSLILRNHKTSSEKRDPRPKTYILFRYFSFSSYRQQTIVWKDFDLLTHPSCLYVVFGPCHTLILTPSPIQR